MAYFGRKPKKPGSVPGAASGNTRRDKAVRAAVGAVRRLAARGRQERPANPGRQSRAARNTRRGR